LLDAIFVLASLLPGRWWSMPPLSRRLLEEKLVRLGEAIEAYELGKPNMQEE